MKSCPKCNRTFPDEGQKFCTFDGGLLIAPQTFDPNATIRATSIDLNAPSERPTSRDLPDPNATIIENYPATVALPRNTGPTTGQPTTSPNTSDIGRPPTPPPAPPPPPPPPPVAATPPPAATAASAVTSRDATTVKVAAGASQPSAPSAPLPAASREEEVESAVDHRGSAVISVAGWRRFRRRVLLCRETEVGRDGCASDNPNRPVENTNSDTDAGSRQSNTPSPTPHEDTFVPPPGTVQFANSKDKLDGELAEHYFDFSFYYPKRGRAIRKPECRRDELCESRTKTAAGLHSGKLRGALVSQAPARLWRLAKLSKASRGIQRVAGEDLSRIPEGLGRPTKVNSMDAYEFRWEGLSKGTEKGDLHLVGPRDFPADGKEGDTTGAILSMFTTSSCAGVVVCGRCG